MCLSPPPPSSSPSSASSSSTTSEKNKKVRVALFTVMEFCVHTILKVVEQRPDTEIAVVITCPGPRSRRSNAYVEMMQALMDAGHPNVDVICSNKRSKYGSFLASYEVDLILCAGFPWLLPADLISDPRFEYGAVNFHNADLPKMRGPNAFGCAIVNGDSHLTFVAHRMEATFDTGALLVKRNFNLDVNDSIQDFFAAMPPLFRGMVDEAITKALAKDPGTPQKGEPTEAPMFDKEFRWIDFSAKALDVHNKVRCYYGIRDFPLGAWAELEGETIRINKTVYRETTTGGGHQQSIEAASGTVLHRDDSKGTLLVQCGDMALLVLEWETVDDAEWCLAESCRPNMAVRTAPAPNKQGKCPTHDTSNEWVSGQHQGLHA